MTTAKTQTGTHFTKLTIDGGNNNCWQSSMCFIASITFINLSVWITDYFYSSFCRQNLTKNARHNLPNNNLTLSNCLFCLKPSNI